MYDFFLLIYLFINIFKIVYESLFLKKKKKNLLERLSLKKYNFFSQDKTVIWIHSVSLGETAAAAPLIKKIKEKIKTGYIILSSSTETGNNKAKELKEADKCIYMPFDLSFVIKRVFRQIKPDIVIFIETDIWFNFLKHSKKLNAKIFLVSAKISEKSANRYSKIKFFSKKIFSYFDLIITQNEDYKKLFIKAHADEKKIIVGKNLKFDIEAKEINILQKNNLIDRLNLKNKTVLSIVSTHDNEEDLILSNIKNFIEDQNYIIFLAPRHPERFNFVYSLIKKKYKNIIKLSEIENRSDEKIVLIDKMGFLHILFNLSKVSIVGGSFIKNIGGHNILEPLLYNTKILFGPYMEMQKDLVNLTILHNIGISSNLADLNLNIKKLLDKDFNENDFINSKKSLIKSLKGSSNIIFENIFK